MRAKPLQSKAFDHRCFGVDSGEGGIGTTALGLRVNHQRFAKCTLDGLRVGCKHAGSERGLQRRTMIFKRHGHLRLWQQFIFDTRIDLVFEILQIVAPHQADAGRGLRTGWNHVAHYTRVSHRPVHIESGLGH